MRRPKGYPKGWTNDPEAGVYPEMKPAGYKSLEKANWAVARLRSLVWMMHDEIEELKKGTGHAPKPD